MTRNELMKKLEIQLKEMDAKSLSYEKLAELTLYIIHKSGVKLSKTKALAEAEAAKYETKH